MTTYPVLVSQMKKREIKREQIAEFLGISPRALRNKMEGRADFTWKQAEGIQKKFFPDVELKTLFREEWESDSVAYPVRIYYFTPEEIRSRYGRPGEYREPQPLTWVRKLQELLESRKEDTKDEGIPTQKE